MSFLSQVTTLLWGSLVAPTMANGTDACPPSVPAHDIPLAKALAMTSATAAISPPPFFQSATRACAVVSAGPAWTLDVQTATSTVAAVVKVRPKRLRMLADYAANNPRGEAAVTLMDLALCHVIIREMPDGTRSHVEYAGDRRDVAAGVAVTQWGGGYRAPRAARRLDGNFIRHGGSYSLDRVPLPVVTMVCARRVWHGGSLSDPGRTWRCLCLVDGAGREQAATGSGRRYGLCVLGQELRKIPDHINPPVEAGRATTVKKWGVAARRLAADM